MKLTNGAPARMMAPFAAYARCWADKGRRKVFARSHGGYGATSGAIPKDPEPRHVRSSMAVDSSDYADRPCVRRGTLATPISGHRVRGRARPNLRIAKGITLSSESAAEGLSWTQPRDKPLWVVRTGLVVDVGPRRRVRGAWTATTEPFRLTRADRGARRRRGKAQDAAARVGERHTSGMS